MGLRGFIRNVTYRVVHKLIAEPKLSRIDRVAVAGFDLLVPPTVFHPSLYFSSKFLAQFVLNQDFQGLRVAELGCGSGIQSLAAASKGALVTASDINPACVRTTRENAERNQLSESVRVFESDLFGSYPADERYDCIIINPPYYKGDATDISGRAFHGGGANPFLTRFFDALPNRLEPHGRVLMVTSSDGDFDEMPRIMRQAGFTSKELGRRKHFFEELAILEITRINSNQS